MGLLRTSDNDGDEGSKLEHADEYDQQHEYTTLKYVPGAKIEDKLNEHAAAGWEVIQQLQSNGTTVKILLRREV